MTFIPESIRWRLALRWRHLCARRYLRRTFENGRELFDSYVKRTPCGEAITIDGLVIRHPATRSGFAQLILEVWKNELYTGSFYQPQPDDTVIDAGANIGLFSLWLTRRQPQCRILAFEPFDENYQFLVENLKSAGAVNVAPFKLALSGSSGLCSMIDGGTRSQDHRLSNKSAGIAGTRTGAVQTCGLDEVLSTTGGAPIALFKCDIEGSEHDLFASATPDKLARVERFAIEYHDNLRSGTLALLQDRLRSTHEFLLLSAAGADYGTLLATRRRGQ